eukprot:GFUD01008868.1.p1 GENE.GFUD01008868.1~~GFUD01008868.1.p1  ORF type:complete len:352 (-),score=105.08 GFUD01008868.1:186-1088(-)
MSERSAVKRCSSPIKTTGQEDIKRNRKKTTNPLLVLLQKGFYSSRKEEYLRQNSKEAINQSSGTDSDLIGSFGMTEEFEPKPCMSLQRQESCPTQTCNQISADILGSLDTSWPVTAVSPSASEKCSFWINTVSNLSRRSSCCLSRGLSCPSDQSRQPSLSTFSSSYTSWTKPIAGHKISDSCIPASSILDKDDPDDKYDVQQSEDLDVCLRERSRRKLRRIYSKNARRASSADTSKDIDDIEDFELDVFDDCDLPHEDDIVFTVNEVSEEGKDKRLSGVMSSPDLAYGSMNGSFDHQDGD